MPKAFERKVKRQGGAVRWRTIKRDGHIIKIAVTRKKGPRGGKTVGYKVL